MEKKNGLLGFYNYTVVLTYIGMLCGFIGIAYAFEGHPYEATIALMAAGFCDMFDGAVASTKKNRTAEEKCFGIQIDSLSDLICFGVLPAVIVYSINKDNYLVLMISAAYALCALIRLAYFNVDEMNRQKCEPGPREFYLGMPVTMSAIIVPALYGAGVHFNWTPNIPLVVALFCSAVLFLLPVRTKKPKIFGKICFLLCAAFEITMVILACGDI